MNMHNINKIECDLLAQMELGVDHIYGAPMVNSEQAVEIEMRENVAKKTACRAVGTYRKTSFSFSDGL